MEVLKVSDFEKPSNGSRHESPKISKTRFHYFQGMESYEQCSLYTLDDIHKLFFCYKINN
jgi:hypothetical protein